MAPRITITADTTAFDADAQELLGRALPSEVKGAVNKAARATVAELKKKLSEIFDRPNAFTLNAFAVLPADSKAGSDTVSALIYVRPQQAGGRRLGLTLTSCSTQTASGAYSQ